MSTPLRIPSLAAVTLGFVISAGMALAQKPADSDYGKVKPEITAAVEKTEAGLVTEPIKMPWRLYVPEGASKDKPLPLLVFLHGAGRRGTDNIGPMGLAWPFITPEAQSKNPCFVFAPQVDEAHRWVNQNFNLGCYDAGKIPATPEMNAALSMVDKLIAGRPIDPRRVYVVGQSMGGYGTWDAMVRRPDLWAAAVPVCGAGDPSQAETIKGIPVWAWHGENDTMVPVLGSRMMIEAITQAGAEPKYNEIPKGGHGVWNRAFADPALQKWLFAQRKP